MHCLDIFISSSVVSPAVSMMAKAQDSRTKSATKAGVALLHLPPCRSRPPDWLRTRVAPPNELIAPAQQVKSKASCGAREFVTRGTGVCVRDSRARMYTICRTGHATKRDGHRTTTWLVNLPPILKSPIPVDHQEFVHVRATKACQIWHMLSVLSNSVV